MVIVPVTVALIVGLTKSVMLDLWFDLGKCDNQVVVYLRTLSSYRLDCSSYVKWNKSSVSNWQLYTSRTLTRYNLDK